MADKTKKIIAREGLIIIGCVTAFLIDAFNGFRFNIYPYAILGYPAYLLVRFIIWAVKTLKGK